jgi:predicted nucleic acid-binding protein
LLERGHVVGPLVHDARVAAICIQHGVTELLTADRDFGRFPALKTVNPLVAT